MRTIKAALITTPNTPFQIVEAELMPPQRGEVQVKIAASGVCHSDWHIMTGDTQHPMPCVAGHEGAGVVVAVGEGVTHIHEGDHVTLSWTPDCGTCFYCQNGQPNLCETYTEPIWRGVMLDGTPRLYWQGEPVYHYCGLGTFGEYVTVPEQSCVVIKKDIPLDVAALVGCAVATGVGAALYTSQVEPGQSVVVYGAGGVGLNVIQGAALAGATTIIAVDTNESKMAIARTFGATHTLMSDTHTVAAIRKLTGGRGADHVFESVGLARLQEEGLEATRPGGTLTLVGLSPMGTATNLPGAVLTRTEKTVRGSYYGSVSPKRDFPRFLDMYQAGRLKLDELISKKYPLEQINEAYADMLSGTVARGVIVFE
ncbi:MAG: alcohol dehydrogenase [Anaerolineaceae bacterium]|nr:alcohol dehydrogenase [Anaerolineaceae bacterium]